MNEYMQLLRNSDEQLENAVTQIHAFEILNQYHVPLNSDEEDISDRQMNDDQFELVQNAMNLVQNEMFRFITTNVHDQIMNGGTQRV